MEVERGGKWARGRPEGTGGDGRDEGCGGGERRSEPRAEAGSLRQRCVCKSVSDRDAFAGLGKYMGLHASVAGTKGIHKE